ncbi:acyl-CoA thioesterase [Rothia halotolerans]|uniref:acyl-CoA thioesterase n=1 Tax=Rothia halotolerans TaxID=405770 RepID=UPI00101D7EDE|nr:thioesterase family protein [Rothia halotolerans]
MPAYPGFVATPEIRWSDQDLMGHVNNARILTLTEDARIQWMLSLAERAESIRPTLVARTEINYRAPVHYGSRLRIELGIGRVGTTSFSITFRGLQNDVVLFDGLNVMVLVDEETGGTRKLTDEQRELLGGFGSFDPERPTELAGRA